MGRSDIVHLSFVILAVFAGGCASDQRAVTIAEYPAIEKPLQAVTPYAGFFLLRQSSTTVSRADSGKPVTILTVYAEQGKPLGFQRVDGRLLAMAGASTQPLAEARYRWETLPGRRDHLEVSQFPSDGSDGKKTVLSSPNQAAAEIVSTAAYCVLETAFNWPIGSSPSFSSARHSHP